MFLHLSIILSTGEGVSFTSCITDHMTSLQGDLHPQGVCIREGGQTPPSPPELEKRVVSYYNAFLFLESLAILFFFRSFVDKLFPFHASFQIHGK